MDEELEGTFQIPPLKTRTSTLIETIIHNARHKRQSALIRGVPGVGKTHTIRKIEEENPSKHKAITASAMNQSPRAFFEELANCFGIYSKWKSRHDIFNHVLGHLCYSDHSQGVIVIIDEAQNLTLETLDVLMDLGDRSGVPYAFVGNHHALKISQVNDSLFNKLIDRVSAKYTVSIDGVHSDDARLFAVHFNVDGVDAYDYVTAYSAGKSLRRLCEFLREGREIAGPRGSIRLQHLREAVASVHGEEDDRKLFKLIPNRKAKEIAA
jgi:hypothetical protein